MLRWLSTVLLFAGLPLAAAQTRVVTLAVDDAHPPYTYVEDGQATGLYVRLLQMAMKDLPGWQLRLVPRPWVRALQESQQGTVDGLLPPYRHAVRDWLSAYAGPLHSEVVVLTCNPALQVTPANRWPADFSRKRIGTTRGYLLTPELTKAFTFEQVIRQEYRDARDALAALASGEIDCYANDLLDILHAHQAALADRGWAARMPAKLEAPYLLSSQQAFVGFSKASLAQRPELLEFVRALDAELAQLRASGDIKRLMDEARGDRK